MLPARWRISGGIVAEKNRVCLRMGTLATILRISFMKPMSSIRSASSSTRISTLCSRISRWFIMSKSLPGVATNMSTPPFMAFC